MTSGSSSRCSVDPGKGAAAGHEERKGGRELGIVDGLQERFARDCTPPVSPVIRSHDPKGRRTRKGGRPVMRVRRLASPFALLALPALMLASRTFAEQAPSKASEDP